VTVSPVSGSRDASPGTQISFLGARPSALSVLSVSGSRSGAHSGHLAAYAGGRGASFLPDRPFSEGERVTVRARLRGTGGAQPLLDEFAIATRDAITTTPEAIHPGGAAEVQSFQSRPDLQPPLLSVTAASAAVAPGEMFVAPYSGPGQAGPMILDQNGGLVWFKGLPRYTSATNFRVQEYAGKPVLTWWQGDISVHGFGRGEGVIADSSYTDIAHVRAGNGDQADLHELQLTPAGTALITAYAPILCNLTSIGGPAYGAVTDGVFQEIDVRTGLVMYEWTSLDHVALSDSYAKSKTSSTHWPFDFFHINSINLDPDGSLLISARNTWAIYDVAPDSGEIAWRLGGKSSSFKAGPGTQTAFQHDPRQLPDGLISLFDNGSYPTVHPQSRGVVLSLDGQTGTATLVSQFVHTPPLIAKSQGNIQALANGDWFIGWGQEPDFSEFSAAGALLFDAHFPVHAQSYRSFRFAWTGTPAHPPVFAFKAGAAGAGVVYASWNGATQVATWRVLAGAHASGLRPLAQAPRSGFETPIQLSSPTTGPFLAVQALDASGRVLGTSPAVAQASLK
jgi:Arylsulfotransferase (ASST)